MGVGGSHPITAVHRHDDPSITTLKLQTPDGLSETITTTPEHPFYVTVKAGNGLRPRPLGHEDLNEHWVGAGHLVTGDKLKLADGREGSVVNVTTQAKSQEMFNLTVAEAHTFFVGMNGWLVHNTDPSPIACPGLTHSKYGVMPKGWDNRTAEHIFEGEIEISKDGRRTAVGWHLESTGDPSKAQIIKIRRNADSNGVYEAKVKIYDSERGEWIEKNNTTFFPKDWDPKKVMSEVEYAFNNLDPKPEPQVSPFDPNVMSYRWEGRSREGILIGGFYDVTNGKMISAFPIRSK